MSQFSFLMAVWVSSSNFVDLGAVVSLLSKIWRFLGSFGYCLTCKVPDFLNSMSSWTNRPTFYCICHFLDPRDIEMFGIRQWNDSWIPEQSEPCDLLFWVPWSRYKTKLAQRLADLNPYVHGLYVDICLSYRCFVGKFTRLIPLLIHKQFGFVISLLIMGRRFPLFPKSWIKKESMTLFGT